MNFRNITQFEPTIILTALLIAGTITLGISEISRAEENKSSTTSNSKQAVSDSKSESNSQNSAAKKLGIFNNEKTFFRIAQKAREEKWQALPIGEVMGKVAKELKGTPYLANTLDQSIDEEVPLVDMNALDCVTFFETTLDFARVIKRNVASPLVLLKEIRLTRYRDGKVGDYSSRLHYTTDWFVDNEKKGVVKILSSLPGAEAFTQKVDFMTKHPNSYKQLAADSKLIEKMQVFEQNINKRSLKFIPVDKVSAIEPLLKTGDIIGLCTNINGLDITHTGIIFRDTDGKAHFMDASSRKDVMKVLIESLPIGEMLEQNKKRSATLTGIMVARPLEPK